MPPDACQSTKAQDAALVVHFDCIDAEVLEAKAAAERPVVAHEALPESLESLAFLRGER